MKRIAGFLICAFIIASSGVFAYNYAQWANAQQQRVQSSQQKSTKMTPYEKAILEEISRIRSALERIASNS